jgi:hypothetical protein
MCVVVTGKYGDLQSEVRSCCVFPWLLGLRRRGINTTPIAFAAAECAGLLCAPLSVRMTGVHAPEALPCRVRGAILRDLKIVGCRITTRKLRMSLGWRHNHDRFQ